MNPLQRSLSHVTAREESKEWLRENLSARQGGRFRPLAAALACLLLMLGVGFWQLWRTPVSYISIDINPSIELALNRLDRVVAVTAYNEDGAAVAQGLSLENRPYQQAMDALLADEVLQSYLGEGARLYVTVVSDREDRLRQGIQGCYGYRDHHGQYYQADRACLTEAHENGLSVGKYRAYLELSSYDATVTVEDCHSMTMGEIEEQIRACGGHQNRNGAGTSFGGGHHGRHH